MALRDHYRLWRLGRTAATPWLRLRDRLLLSDRLGPPKWAWPVQGTAPVLSTSPFFIIGNPRSGTTLLRSILSQHHNVFIPPYNVMLGKMINTFGIYRTLPWRVVVSAVLEDFSKGYEFRDWCLDLNAVNQAAQALPQEERTLVGLIRLIYQTYGALHAPGKTQWGDKSAGNSFALSKIDLVFPKARYIHIVRDGRDSVASMVKAGFAGRDYIHAAYQWKDNVRACHRFGNMISPQNRFFQLHYENLITSPEKEISALCQFLYLEPEEAMWQHHKKVTELVPDVLTIPHHKNVTKPIFHDSVGNWKRQIPQSELGSITIIMKRELALFGYE